MYWNHDESTDRSKVVNDTKSTGSTLQVIFSLFMQERKAALDILRFSMLTRERVVIDQIDFEPV